MLSHLPLKERIAVVLICVGIVFFLLGPFVMIASALLLWLPGVFIGGAIFAAEEAIMMIASDLVAPEPTPGSFIQFMWREMRRERS